jgi:hypothetical protein
MHVGTGNAGGLLASCSTARMGSNGDGTAEDAEPGQPDVHTTAV